MTELDSRKLQPLLMESATGDMAELSTANPLQLLHISNSDTGGGAERVARELHRMARVAGHHSLLAVGRKLHDEPDVVEIPGVPTHGRWGAFWLHAEERVGRADAPGGGRLARVARLLAEPGKVLGTRLGWEDFEFAGTWRVLDLATWMPDVVHCHNLHGGYFDLRALPWLSRRRPVLLTLHDAWLLSGHCAHSLACERWLTGCGTCPDLSLYPSIQRDATAFNWRRKQKIYARSRLHVATPCQWLMNKVEQSMLAPAVVEGRVIPNGVDLEIFHPREDRGALRARLGIPDGVRVVLSVANDIRRNVWKDFATLESAIKLVGRERSGRPVLFVCIGEEESQEEIGGMPVRFLPFERDVRRLAAWFQAADLFVHPARADTFPSVVLEALACGTPVVATAVGGIPEQVRGLHAAAMDPVSSANLPAEVQWNADPAETATGILTQPGRAAQLAAAVLCLLSDEPLRAMLARNAARDARQRFDMQQQTRRYFEWYDELRGHSSDSAAREVRSHA